MKADKIILAIVLFSFLILAAGIILVSRMSAPPKINALQDVKVQTSETSYSWGNIPLNGGKVKKTFMIENIGSAPLQLANVKTSCMCTTARVIIGSHASPFFGMHTQSAWIGTVAPGKRAKLIIVFDPAYHGLSGLGQITREVAIETNDPAKPKIIFTLTGNVTKK